MGTLTDKLQQILQTKEGIKNAILNKGIEVDSSLPFSAYSRLIDAINTNIPLSISNLWTGDNIFTIDSDNITLTDAKYSTDGSTWVDFTGDFSYTMGEGETIYITASDVSINNEEAVKFYTSNIAKVEGELSALNGYNEEVNSLQYAGIFYGWDTLLDSAYLLLPPTTASYCYRNAFRNCFNLASAPYLKASVTTEGCYHSMFKGCSNLIYVPIINAENLAYLAFVSMFEDCKNIENIRIRVEDWDVNNAYNWLNGIPVTETINPDWRDLLINGYSPITIDYVKNIYIPINCDISTGSVSGIPSGWNVYTNNY